MRLEGKVAIVTGGGQGIGQGIVQCLAEEGADLAVVDLNEDAARKVAGEVEAIGRKSLAIKADVTDSKQVGRAVRETMDTFGEIDILVNNVGGARAVQGLTGVPPGTRRQFIDIEEAEWDMFFEVNVKTQFLMCRAVVPHLMEKRSGKIVNIGSWLGQRPGLIQLFAYSVAKAAVVHFTRLLATELAEHNINVNCVHPGDVLNPTKERMFTQRIQADPDAKGKTPEDLFMEIAGPRRPIKRLEKPEDIGHAVVFLASEDARNITGHSLNVDGGQVMY